MDANGRFCKYLICLSKLERMCVCVCVSSVYNPNEPQWIWKLCLSFDFNYFCANLFIIPNGFEYNSDKWLRWTENHSWIFRCGGISINCQSYIFVDIFSVLNAHNLTAEMRIKYKQSSAAMFGMEMPILYLWFLFFVSSFSTAETVWNSKGLKFVIWSWQQFIVTCHSNILLFVSQPYLLSYWSRCGALL